MDTIKMFLSGKKMKNIFLMKELNSFVFLNPFLVLLIMHYTDQLKTNLISRPVITRTICNYHRLITQITSYHGKYFMHAVIYQPNHLLFHSAWTTHMFNLTNVCMENVITYLNHINVFVQKTS